MDRAFGLDVSVEHDLVGDIDATLEDLAVAAMAAADAVSEWGKRALRADTEKALGPRVARTWRARVYPNRGGQASLSPSITWWTNAPHIIDTFARGATVRSKDGFWLAIPTENAPDTGRSFSGSGRLQRSRRHAITQAERRFGKLRFVKIPGKRVALLVADRVQQNKRGYGPASQRTLRQKREENGVVMFILVPHVDLPKSIDPQAIADAIGREGLDRFARAFKEITQRRFAAPGGSP